MDRGWVWMTIALVLVIIGYSTPNLVIGLAPAVTIRWINPLFITIVFGPTVSYTRNRVWWLLPIPFFLAIISWAGVTFLDRQVLRYGLYPFLLVVIAYLIFTLFLTQDAEILLAFNCIPFTLAILSSHRVKKPLTNATVLQ